MQSALQTIGLICAINQIPFDPKSIINKFALTKKELHIWLNFLSLMFLFWF